eukprot:CAMPEP_0183357398 /NCGR_PEP_ID=MMETSP0164_2-20130417/46153_1 /TAXON_ID=221442 /ORGANISM="Coccolithus pelagicus ssp braarudi, Strain PLY182g" /LENGTH=422 /DNA_ID=CAMNT_0025530997 /DNA_START=17 /DNA_END=1285 /DNA_ORIENTATION=+
MPARQIPGMSRRLTICVLMSLLGCSSGLHSLPFVLRESGVSRAHTPRAIATLEANSEVVEVSRTEETVLHLNSVSLDSHRCHSISKDEPPVVDPFGLVREQLEPLSAAVRHELEAESTGLADASQHFFGSGAAREGKRVRPVLVLLMAQATQLAGGTEPDATDVERRMQLASITEMIHTASLIHDDVLDAADTRRGDSAVHKRFSNKAAVLSGDFLLARASVALAKLGHAQVTHEMAKSLEALVQGELMQLKSTPEQRLDMQYYLTKSYCKTASLMAYSCKSSALLSGHELESDITVAAEKFGYHFGLAFQVIDDLLDFTGSSESLGKPGLQDMQLGLSTAPVLYAAEDFPELKALISRKFGEEGDVQNACKIVINSAGLRRTKDLATFHAQAAVDACCTLPESEQRDGLVNLCHKVLSRSS